MPTKQPCDCCKAEMAMMADVVRKGGIYWKCDKCGNSGVIQADSATAKQVRLAAKTPAPKSIGIDFEPDQCPVCSGKIKEG